MNIYVGNISRTAPARAAPAAAGAASAAAAAGSDRLATLFERKGLIPKRGSALFYFRGGFLIIRHLELTFIAEKPPPSHAFEQVALMAALMEAMRTARLPLRPVLMETCQRQHERGRGEQGV